MAAIPRLRAPTRAEARAWLCRRAEGTALWWRFLDRERAAGVLLGLSAPLVVFGNAVLALLFGLASILALFTMRDRVQRWRWRGLFLTPAGALGGATLLWWALSSVFSIDPLGSAEVVARMVAFIALACVLLVALAERTDARRLAEHVFLAAFAGATVLAAAAMYGSGGMLRFFAPFAGDLTDPVTFFKSYTSLIALALPVALWIGWRAGGRWLALALAASMACAFLLWGDGHQPGRSAIAGLFAAALAVALAVGLRRASGAVRMRMAVALLLAVSVVAAAVFAALPTPPVTEADRADPPLPLVDLHRQAIWGFVFDKALERPMLGHGINTINKVDGAKQEVLDLNQEYVPSHPHNWVLEILAETGAPGLVLLLLSQLAIALAFLRAGWKGRAGGYAGLAVMAAFWASSLANFSIWSAWWQVSFLSILVLPAARAMGPVIERREPDDLPQADVRRIALCALALLLAVLLALVWYARRTEEGYILYKRLKAESEYTYDEIRPEFREVDPSTLIRPSGADGLAAIRADMIDAIWGEDGLPAERLPETARTVTGNPYGLVDGMEGVAIERLEMPIAANYASVGYVLKPEAPNGDAVIYQHGYAGDLSQAKEIVQTLLAGGYTVGALNFPGYAENAYRTYEHPRFGPVNFDHDFLLFYVPRPMRFYIEPPVIMANHLRETYGIASVDLAGFSAGGWAIAVASAADPRFDRTISVASYLPLYLRDRTNPGEWTPPHLYGPLLQATNYLEVALMASVGPGRGHLQVFNRYDRCCYRNRLGTLYDEAVDDRVEAIGQGGRFAVAIDETHAEHMLSPWAVERMMDFLSASDGDDGAETPQD